MNNEEAKKILSLYRPGTPDQTDPSFADAREKATPASPDGKTAGAPEQELAQWFKDHSTSYDSIRKKFKEIPVPAGLREQILAEVKPKPENVVALRPSLLLRLAAAIVVCLGLGAYFWHAFRSSPSATPPPTVAIQSDTFDHYRDAVTAAAVRPYDIFKTNDLQAINAFFSAHGAPASYTLPEGLSSAKLVGCSLVNWEGRHAAMICFKSGRPLAPGQKMDLWFFVGDTTSLQGVPTDATPSVAKVQTLTTASWTKDGKVYVLAGAGDEAFLRKYL